MTPADQLALAQVREWPTKRFDAFVRSLGDMLRDRHRADGCPQNCRWRDPLAVFLRYTRPGDIDLAMRRASGETGPGVHAAEEEDQE